MPIDVTKSYRTKVYSGSDEYDLVPVQPTYINVYKDDRGVLVAGSCTYRSRENATNGVSSATQWEYIKTIEVMLDD